MFRQTRVRLTLIYSLLFLAVVWLLSLGAYFWMDGFFHLRYPQEVHDQYVHELSENDRHLYDWDLSRIASNLALDRFRTLLIVVNGLLLIIVPGSAWLITGMSLKPIEETHAREQQFVSDVSHDLRTPLSIMSAELEVALLKNRPVSEYQTVIKSSKEEVDRLSSLVENLLFLTRQQTSKTSITMKSVDLTDIVSSIVSRFTSTLREKNIAIQIKPPTESIEVNANSTLLGQLFANLIENAILYSKNNGKIIIKINRTNDYATIAIQDTGIGISQKDQQRIFDRFYRVDSSRTEKGYGLGLAIASTIVDLHRGRIDVISEPKKGSTFTVYLPVIKQTKRKNTT